MKGRSLIGSRKVGEKSLTGLSEAPGQTDRLRACREMKETKQVYHQRGAPQGKLEARSIRKCCLEELPPLWAHRHVGLGPPLVSRASPWKDALEG